MCRSSKPVFEKDLKAEEDIAEKYYIPPGLTKKSIVVDGGAYCGQWTKHMMLTYGCQIFAIEPHYENTFFLRQIFCGCNKPVTIVEAALWDVDGTRHLYVDDSKYKKNACSMYARFKVKRMISVITITIKTLMKKYKIDKIDLLKLNVEGSEVDILTSLDKSTAAKIPYICFAPHDGKIVVKKAHNEMLKHLKSIGYKIQIHTSKSWGPSFKRVVCIHENTNK